MLKSKISKTEYDALSDDMKEHYKAAGDDYLLQSDGLDELRNLLATERDARKQLETDLKAIKDAADAAKAAAKDAEDKAAEEAAKKRGDISALEASWSGKVDAARNEAQAKVDKLTGMLEKLMVDNTAIAMANEISTSPTLMIPIIKARLKAELDGDTPLTRVLDADGKPSAANIADLKAELIANNEFAAIIRGSNASGGGANGGHSGGGAAKKISEMSETERVALHRANPDAYREQARAEGLSVYG